MSEVIAHRAMLERDIPFVTRSYLMSYRQSRWSGVPGGECWFAHYRKVFEELLKRPCVSVVIAINPGEEDPRHEIYGYLVHEKLPAGDCVHYVYVKQAYRKMGVMKYLLNAAGLQDRFKISHLSKHWVAIQRHYKDAEKSFGGVYDPKLASITKG